MYTLRIPTQTYTKNAVKIRLSSSVT
jgi:hypothetical protein